MRRVLLPQQFTEPPAPADGPIRDFTGLSMGTSWSVRLAGGPPSAALQQDLQQGLQQQLDLVVAQMSHWEAQSDLGRFNRAGAESWHHLPSPFFEVLSFAMGVAHDSGHAYHPGAGALVNLWGFGPAGGFDQPGFKGPDAEQVAAVLARLRDPLRRLELDTAGRRARQPGALQLDLSSVAKGYSVDLLAGWLERQGVFNYLVEVGGELRGAGTKPDGQPWWVMLEQPAQYVASGPQETVLALHGLAVATSGDYRRFFDDGQRRYSHTIDPRSGMPIENDIASVTVVHRDCMAADAWSTALTVLGPQAGLILAERHNLAARFVLRGGARPEILSSAMHAMAEDA